MIMPKPLRVAMVGGHTGRWKVEKIEPVRGPGLPQVECLDILEGEEAFEKAHGVWVLKGVTSNQRYVTQQENAELNAKQEGLGRPAATRASLIPIKKSETWWSLAQDERRKIFEDQSRHISGSLKYLPAIARRLHHSRDLGEAFDFLTWFEFAPEHEALFDELVAMLRATPEWNYVEREVDIRLFLKGV
jgi:chlorite dismutase